MDDALRQLDLWIGFGHDPGLWLHQFLGTGVTAHFLSLVYMFFMPFVPVSLVMWLVWSRHLVYGYWYATALCVNWVLGVVSYYAVPSLGPAFAAPWLYSELNYTAASMLQDSLYNSRTEVLLNPFTSTAISSVAGFASLHVSITLTVALMVHLTFRRRWVRRLTWVYFGLTVVATIYLGWHYIADDVAGVGIGFFAVWAGARAVGLRMVRYRDRPGVVQRAGHRPHPT